MDNIHWKLGHGGEEQIWTSLMNDSLCISVHVLHYFVCILKEKDYAPSKIQSRPKSKICPSKFWFVLQAFRQKLSPLFYTNFFWYFFEILNVLKGFFVFGWAITMLNHVVISAKVKLYFQDHFLMILFLLVENVFPTLYNKIWYVVHFRCILI